VTFRQGETYSLGCHEEGCSTVFEWTPTGPSRVAPRFCPGCRSRRQAQGLDRLWSTIQADSDSRGRPERVRFR